MKMIPIQVMELTEKGYVVALSFQKDGETVRISCFCEDEERLGARTAQLIRAYRSRN